MSPFELNNLFIYYNYYKRTLPPTTIDGQTGAGKTYTILGPSAASAVGVDDEVSREIGIIPRALGELFGGLEKSKKEGNHFSLDHGEKKCC